MSNTLLIERIRVASKGGYIEITNILIYYINNLAYKLLYRFLYKIILSKLKYIISNYIISKLLYIIIEYYISISFRYIIAIIAKILLVFLY